MKHLHNELFPDSTLMQNLLLCFTLDARISNILIFMRYFFHQTNKSFYLRSLTCLCFKCESGLEKTEMTGTDMYIARQTAFYCYCLSTASLLQTQFTFHITRIKQKFLICQGCVIMTSKVFVFLAMKEYLLKQRKASTG